MSIEVTRSSAASTGTQSVKKKDENSPEAIQERFMSLLVAQLKNQDPLAPMDNAQVTSQMAQLNTVTGINNLNDSMGKMASAFSANQTAQAVSMLGRTVMTDGDGLMLQGGKATGAVELKQSADTVRVDILNAKGDVIRAIDLGANGKGIHEFEWDGKDSAGASVPEGSYRFEVKASAAGLPAELSTLTKSVVQGVRNAGAEGSKLLTSNGQEVNFTDIKQVF